MNTNTRNKPLISKRKQDHIDVCRNGSGFEIESKADCGFDSIKFIHQALPELSCDDVTTEIDFLGKQIRFPLFISCMTGGSEEGYRANRELALAAQKMKIPLGLGSMRVLLEEPWRIKDFAMRDLAPDVPLMGNLGAVQLREKNLEEIKELVQRLRLDALVIHLNCGQELFQAGGDRDFRGLKNSITKAAAQLDIPLIVKETGFGIRPALAKELIETGVTYVDIAGAGGTNWILVERSCNGTEDSPSTEFADWGIATPILLDATKEFTGKILASGGLRSGMDLAKAIALGAFAGGMALPFIRSALNGGSLAVCKQIEGIEKVLKSVMVLTGAKTVSEFRSVPLLRTASFEHESSSLKTIDLG